MIITIDGPAGSGKSTLSLMLAKELYFFCLNSGYLYRGIAYVLQTYYGYDEKKLKNPEVNDIKTLLDSGDFYYDYQNGLSKIFFKEDITQFLKQISVAKAAALLAQNSEVRNLIRAYKRSLVDDKDTVIEGRVCGSVVFSDADLKLYMIASPEVRAKRVVKQQAHRGTDISFDEALEAIEKRDQVDMTRSVDPLVKPKGAIVLDTSTLTKKEMLKEALKHVRRVMKEQEKMDDNA